MLQRITGGEHPSGALLIQVYGLSFDFIVAGLGLIGSVAIILLYPDSSPLESTTGRSNASVKSRIDFSLGIKRLVERVPEERDRQPFLASDPFALITARGGQSRRDSKTPSAEDQRTLGLPPRRQNSLTKAALDRSEDTLDDCPSSIPTTEPPTVLPLQENHPLPRRVTERLGGRVALRSIAGNPPRSSMSWAFFRDRVAPVEEGFELGRFAPTPNGDPGRESAATRPTVAMIPCSLPNKLRRLALR